jgi:hypothetical protein
VFSFLGHWDGFGLREAVDELDPPATGSAGPAGSAAPDAAPTLVVEWLADVAATPIDWIWPLHMACALVCVRFLGPGTGGGCGRTATATDRLTLGAVGVS